MSRKFTIPYLAVRVTVFLVIAGLATAVYACPNCKNAVGQNSDTMSLGFAWSIGLMLMAPFAVLSAWALAIRKYCLRFQQITG